MLDTQVRQNSWILADREERLGITMFDAQAYVTEMGIHAWAQWVGTPIYDQMQAYFWFQRFTQMKYHELSKLTRRLGYPNKGSKDILVSRLTAHFAAITKVRGF